MSRPALREWMIGLAALALLSAPPAGAQSAAPAPEWPRITQEARPWTRWWWQGSSVEEAELAALLEEYARVGLGGVEITPIYGVAGHEPRFIDYLSPRWVDRLAFTLREARRLGLGVDMATGTGWPFGGPWVTGEHASKYVAHRVYSLEGGERLAEPVAMRQEPIVRAVGNQIYESHGILRVPGEPPQGSMERPLERPGTRPIAIGDLLEPVARNPNLQALALDQVRFPRPLPLQALMAYSAAGAVLDLTALVDGSGRLDWVAPAGSWTLYALFQGWHGKQVERAAPGGEGDVIDHFSGEAIGRYLHRFDEAFAGRDLSGLRAFFNDSYEVDDASGQSNWTPRLFEEFRSRRGYDLRHHLPALFGQASEERNARVLSDFRQTFSDLILDRFTEEWREWARGRGAIVRNQAHGSPANILDLYAASDIPETEGTEMLRIKFASSAAHVTGKPLVSSESATWLNEHFTSTLADVKRALDRFMLGGVNHVFYHGTAYSPRREAWPGWLFYASVHFSPANPWWTDFAALNRYVARTQAFLQAGKPDNDVLFYFPVFDFYAERGRELLEHFHGVPRASESVFQTSAEALLARGYAFDLVSDRQLLNVAEAEGSLRTGGLSYRAVVLPETRYLPLETFERLVQLAREGATVVVHRRLPTDVPGLGDLERRRGRFRELVGELPFAPVAGTGIREARVGSGAFLVGEDLDELLSRAGVRRESMVDRGLHFVRRRNEDGTTYFIANWGERPVDGWIPLEVPAGAAALFDPLLGRSGFASLRSPVAGRSELYLQLAPGETRIVRTRDGGGSGGPWEYLRPTGAPREIQGSWTIRFIEGGPELPPATRLARLGSWTDLDGEAVKSFSGTATYSVSFRRPAAGADRWILDLGRVHESARVRLNGRDLGTLLGPTFRVALEDTLLRDENVLEVSVSNLMANRIADLDRRERFWKKFYNVNFPARLRENRGENGLFDASRWSPRASGLLGPVTLTPAGLFRPESDATPPLQAAGPPAR